jgi:hypothetical protein
MPTKKLIKPEKLADEQMLLAMLERASDFRTAGTRSASSTGRDSLGSTPGGIPGAIEFVPMLA